MKKCLIIIPAYNEEKNISKAVEQLLKVKVKNYKLDYIIINDGSKDSTREVCLKNNYNTVNLINNLGIGGAVQTGYKYAYYNNYDVAIQYDGDGQHDPNYIEALLKEIDFGNNLVIGSRFIESLSKFTSTKSRQIGIKILSFFIKLVSGVKIYDPTSGFRAVDKEVIKLFYSTYPVEYPEPSSTVNVIKEGFKVKEIPVEMKEREHGKSSITLHKSIYYMISVCIAIVIDGMKRRKKI